MISKIALRGISRTPTDRMTSDGGCFESINVRVNDGELRPIPAPVDVTDALLGSFQFHDRIIYAHTTATYTNYIGQHRDEDGKLVLSAYMGNPRIYQSVITTFEDTDMEIKSITSIGNTIVASTNSGIRYILYKDGEYVDKGSKIPSPRVYFDIERGPADSTTVPVPAKIEPGDFPTSDLDVFCEGFPDDGSDSAKLVWSVLRGILLNNGVDAKLSGLAGEINEALWGSVNKMVAKHRNRGEFVSPVMLRYAIKLYDGSYLYQSSPVLLSGEAANRFFSTQVTDFVTAPYLLTGFNMRLNFNNIFKVKVVVDEYSKDWEDLIAGVEIFAAEDLRLPVQSAKIEDLTYISDTEFTWKYKDESGDDVADFEKVIESRGNFYLMESINMDALTNENPEDDVERELKPLGADNLVVKDRLPDGQSHYITPLGSMSVYNNRLIMGGVKIMPWEGNNSATGLVAGTGDDDLRIERVVYKVRDEFGNSHDVLGFGGQTYLSSELCAYISYPAANCYQADVYVTREISGGADVKSVCHIPMKEHPALDCAYGFWGLDKQLLMTGHGSDERRTEPYISIMAQPAPIIYWQKLYMSEVDNPFVWPVVNRFSFSGGIIGVAGAGIILSAGQPTTHDLYVFTQTGVYVIKIKGDGGFEGQQWVSDDIATPGTIVSMDQAVCFFTDAGVMLITGSQPQCISTYMDGAPEAVSGYLSQEELEGYGFGELGRIARLDNEFRDFFMNAIPVYDSAGQRLILFNSLQSYQYVYYAQSQTWHKMFHDLKREFTNVINHPAKALVCLGGQEKEIPQLVFKRTVLFDWGYDESIDHMEFVNMLTQSLGEEMSRYSFDPAFDYDNWDMYVNDLEDALRNGMPGIFILGLTNAQKDYLEIDFRSAQGAGFIPEDATIEFDAKNVVDGTVVVSDGDCRIYDYSEVLKYYTSRGQAPVKGLIISRAIDLDQPFVFKRINKVMIRGMYPLLAGDRRPLSYMLYASNDGQEWHRLRSLRGPSWKFFKVVVLADLKPRESLSYLEADYTALYGNKLR